MHGEAGIGKTTLLEALVERSGGTVTVVRACGAETEAELAFSALADLLEPVLGELAALPAPQAAALGARSRSVLRLRDRRRPATGWLSASPRSACCGPPLGAARCSPWWTILQWIDASSRECIESPPPGRRAARGRAGGAGSVSTCRGATGLPELRVGPVDEAGAAHAAAAPGARACALRSPRRSRRPPRATRWPWWSSPRPSPPVSAQVPRRSCSRSRRGRRLQRAF